MLRLSSPFMTNENVDFTRKARIETIDVSYCAVKDRTTAMSIDSGGPLIDFSSDAKLVPSSEGVLCVLMQLRTCTKLLYELFLQI